MKKIQRPYHEENGHNKKYRWQNAQRNIEQVLNIFDLYPWSGDKIFKLIIWNPLEIGTVCESVIQYSSVANRRVKLTWKKWRRWKSRDTASWVLKCNFFLFKFNWKWQGWCEKRILDYFFVKNSKCIAKNVVLMFIQYALADFFFFCVACKESLLMKDMGNRQSRYS